MSAKAVFQNGTLAIYINHEHLTNMLFTCGSWIEFEHNKEVIFANQTIVTISPALRDWLLTVYNAEAEAFYQAAKNRPHKKRGRKSGGHNKPKVTHG